MLVFRKTGTRQTMGQPYNRHSDIKLLQIECAQGCVWKAGKALVLSSLFLWLCPNPLPVSGNNPQAHKLECRLWFVPPALRGQRKAFLAMQTQQFFFFFE